MKNLIIIGVVGAILFGSSYFVSSLMLVKNEPSEEDKTAESKNADETESDDQATQETMPAPVKAPSLTEENLVRMIQSINKRGAELQQREQDLLEREKNHRFIVADIQQQKREYEALVNEVQGKIEQANKLLALVDEKKKEIVDERKKIEAMQKMAAQSNENQDLNDLQELKKMADLLGAMPVEKAAATFTSYAEDGKMAWAARILKQIDEQNASKILAAIPDTKLVAEFLEQMGGKRSRGFSNQQN